MSLSRNAPSIYRYGNYRAFLADLVAFMKLETTYFSYRYFSKKAGLKSPNFLKLVIDGKRDLSMETARVTARVFGLSAPQTRYFKLLVEFNQTKDQREKRKIGETLLKIQKVKNISPLDRALYNYFTQWYYVVIREMVSLQNFQADPLWISEHLRPSVFARDVKVALQELLALGLIEPDKRKGYRIRDPHLSTGNDVIATAAAEFHLQMMVKGAESIERFPSSEREISSVTLSISSQDLPRLKEMLIHFREEFIESASNPKDSDQVYQFNFQFFPVTKKS